MNILCEKMHELKRYIVYCKHTLSRKTILVLSPSDSLFVLDLSTFFLFEFIGISLTGPNCRPVFMSSSSIDILREMHAHYLDIFK